MTLSCIVWNRSTYASSSFNSSCRLFSRTGTSDCRIGTRQQSRGINHLRNTIFVFTQRF